MGKIHLKAQLSDITTDNLHEFSLENGECREMHTLFNREGFIEAFIKLDLSINQQDTLNNYTRLSLDNVCEIIKNSTKVATCLLHRHKDIPIEVLTENATKLPLYYIEYQVNITPEFFKKYRSEMDSNAFLEYRSQLGDIHKFIDVAHGDSDYITRFLTYKTSRQSVFDMLITINPELDVVNTNKVLDEIYNHVVNIDYLTDCYTNTRGVSHNVRDVVTYYNNNHKSSYASWDEYVSEAIENECIPLANIWFRDVFQKRIIELLN